MNDFLRWLGEQAGNVLGVLGLVTGFVFYWISRRPKRFGWEIMSQAPILSLGSGHLPLKVVYDGKDVSSPRITVVRLGNTGKAELQAGDFDGPVRIEFPLSNVLQIFVSGRSTNEIDPAISKDSFNSVYFTPTLLNPGEWIELQFVTDGPEEKPVIRSRVAGQRAGAPRSIASRKKILNLVGWAALGFGLGLPGLLWAFGRSPLLDALMPLTFILVLGGLFVSSLGDSSVWRKAPKPMEQARQPEMLGDNP